MPLRQIKIVVDEPILPESQNIEHTSTSFVIGNKPDLNKDENIIEKKEKVTDNKLVCYFDVDIDYDTIVFVKCKYHFTMDGEEVESDWSRVVPVNSLQTGIKLSSSIVKTPSVSIEEEHGLIYIKTSDFRMFSGPGAHHSTDFKITDTDGFSVFSRENDQDNLTSIYIKDQLEDGKIFAVQARHTNSTNNTSYFGKTLFSNYSPDLNLFSFDAPEDFVINRRFYYRIKIWVNKFESYDLELRNDKGEVIMSVEKDKKTTSYLMLTHEKLVLFQTYHIFVRINFTDGTSTDFKNVMTSALLDNIVNNYDPDIMYADKYRIGKPRNTKGITCATFRETFDGRVVGVDYVTNALYLFKIDGVNLVPMNLLYEFDKSLDIDYVNIVQLADQNILVDIVIYNKHRQALTTFLLFEYDPIKLTFTLLKQKDRKDEKYTTSVSNSLLVTNNNEIYYIPSYLTNGKNDERIWLKLRKVDPTTLDITDIPLPYEAKYFANVIQDHLGNVYVFGGSQFNEYDTDEEGRNVEVWKNHCKEVYALNKETNTFDLWSALPDNYPEDVYCLQPILRIDGKNILFNGCWSGKGLQYNKFITFDAYRKTFNDIDINGKVEVPVRSNIIYRNGDIIRLTAKTTDEQSVLIYNANSNPDDEIPDFDDIDKETLELVVQNGEVVNIEDIYKYTKIDIRGSGILKWYRPQGITELTSKDLIVLKNTKVTQASLNAKGYRSILVLDGVDFQITTTSTTSSRSSN